MFPNIFLTIDSVKNYNNNTHDFVSNEDIQIKAETFIMNQWILSDLQKRCIETKDAEV